jgi:hypothetical protein
MNLISFVEGCLHFYAEHGLIQGNPDDGDWDDAHHPVPLCLGGTQTVKLLREHHAIHGVIQSEELQRPCIYSWELEYLSGDWLTLAKKWMTVKGKMAMEKRWSSKSEEERSHEAKERLAHLSEEKRREWGDNIRNARTYEQFSEAAKKGKANMTPEARSEATRKGWATRKANSRTGTGPGVQES